MSFMRRISSIVKRVAPVAMAMYAPGVAPLVALAQGRAPALDEVMPAVLTTPQIQGTTALLRAAVGGRPAAYQPDDDDDYDDEDDFDAFDDDGDF